MALRADLVAERAREVERAALRWQRRCLQRGERSQQRRACRERERALHRVPRRVDKHPRDLGARGRRTVRDVAEHGGEVDRLPGGDARGAEQLPEIQRLARAQRRRRGGPLRAAHQMGEVHRLAGGEVRRAAHADVRRALHLALDAREDVVGDQVLVDVGVDVCDPRRDVRLECGQERALDGEVAGDLGAGAVQRLEHRLGRERVGSVVLDRLDGKQVAEAGADADQLVRVDAVRRLAGEIVDHQVLLHRRVVDERELLDLDLVLRATDRVARGDPLLEDLDEVAVEGGLDLRAMPSDLRHRLEEDLLLGARGGGVGGDEEVVLDLVESVGEDAAQLGARELAALTDQRLALRRGTGADVSGRAGGPHGRLHTQTPAETAPRVGGVAPQARPTARRATARMQFLLERLHPGAPAGDADRWTGAACVVLFDGSTMPYRLCWRHERA